MSLIGPIQSHYDLFVIFYCPIFDYFFLHTAPSIFVIEMRQAIIKM